MDTPNKNQPLHALLWQVVFACCACALFSPAHAQELVPSVVTTSFADAPVAPNGFVSLTFNQPLHIPQGRIAVFYGKEDVTMNFSVSAPEVLQGDFSQSPLASGSDTLKVFFVTSDNRWIELAHIPLAIASNPASSSFKPSLVLGAKTQTYEKTEAATTPSGRNGYIDLTLQAGLEAATAGEDWKIQSQMAVMGSSYRNEAVTYATNGAKASQIDLASYLVQGNATNRFGEASLSLGDVQFGNHAALVNELSNRGVLLAQKFGSRVDVSFASQAGGAILGANNLLGVNDAGHRINSLTLGTELLERASGLRMEISHTDASIRAQTMPGTGFVPAAEKSRGWGIRMMGKTEDEALHGDVLYSVSDYTPAGDASLGIAAGPSSRAPSYVLDMGYAALRDAKWGELPAALNLGVRRERAGLGYLSLAANFGADYLLDTATLNATLGVVNAVLQLTQREDNIDNQPAFMKNKVQGTALTLNTPLAQLLNPSAPSAWLPSLGYTFNRSHNFADAGFIPLGQTVADLPDVLVTTHGLNFAWAIAPFTLGYTYNRTLQDTLQLAFATRDLLDTRHAFNFAWRPDNQISINSSLDTTQSLQRDSSMARSRHNGQIAFNWIANTHYTFTGQLNLSVSNDNLNTQSQRTQQMQWQMARNFDWTRPDSSKSTGQWYVKFMRNLNESTNPNWLPTSVRTGKSTLLLGINLTFL